MRKTVYSKQDLLDILKNYAKKYGRPPTRRELNADPLMPSDMSYRRVFGSWGNALLECGFDIPKPFPSEQCRKAVSETKRKATGVNSPVWKGGRYVDISGYVYVRNNKKRKYEREHRKKMEDYLHRELTQDEDVHHINGCKADNRIDNLMIISKSEHTKLHASLGHHNHTAKMTKTCMYPGCESKTSSIYCLCRKHYKIQWDRMRRGVISDMTEFKIISRTHSDETKKRLSELAKRQPRKNGRFGNIHNNPIE